MTPELIAIITATVALAGLILNGNRALSQGLDRMEARLSAVEREQAHLAGLLEGLREAISGHRAA
jgi:hypothetical protein